MTEAVGATLVPIYQTTRRYILEDCNIYLTYIPKYIKITALIYRSGWSEGNALGLYSGGALFESRPGHWQS
jgi:hypothetical protein